MDTDPLTPAPEKAPHKRKPAGPPKGRPADLLACGIAIIAAVLAALGSALFFLGFAANDSVLAGLVSAFAFSVLLGAFAVGPAVIIAFIAWRGWKSSMSRANAFWVILLTLPWVILSWLALLMTPLSKLLSLCALGFSFLLLAWGFISLILSSRRNFGPK